MKFETIVEQRRYDEYRNKYNANENVFIKTEYKSLLFERGFTGVYGWLLGYGTPPEKHLDVLTLTKREYDLGDIIRINIVGVFIRNDHDNKLIGIEENRNENDFYDLPIEERNMLLKLYPCIRDGEGWFGKEKAFEIIKDYTLNYKTN